MNVFFSDKLTMKQKQFDICLAWHGVGRDQWICCCPRNLTMCHFDQSTRWTKKTECTNNFALQNICKQGSENCQVNLSNRSSHYTRTLQCVKAMLSNWMIDKLNFSVQSCFETFCWQIFETLRARKLLCISFFCSPSRSCSSVNNSGEVVDAVEQLDASRRFMEEIDQVTARLLDNVIYDVISNGIFDSNADQPVVEANQNTRWKRNQKKRNTQNIHSSKS